jgi:hypothetical protein
MFGETKIHGLITITFVQAEGVTSYPVPVVFEALVLSLVITAASI